MTDREKIIQALKVRAAGKRIYGFSSDKAGCTELPTNSLPEALDWVCVEGDEKWVRVPREAS